MVTAQPDITEVWTWLGSIPDPEIPVLSILDLGIVRDVEWNSESDELTVTITPTYSGCPAMVVIAENIRTVLANRGIPQVRLEKRLSPAWTTDWLTVEAKRRLQEYGIAPPEKLVKPDQIQPLQMTEPKYVRCPRCHSDHTELVSRFGSTPCKALYKCLDCLEPFDTFKQH